MSGHNKWSKIRHKKERTDKKRAKVWSACARDIIMAARSGGGDISANLHLQYAVTEAKRVNMPNDTIARAIKRGTGELEGADPEELIYEGYGPGGVALLVQALTDNRHRTAPIIKRHFERFGGKLSAQGSVAYLFESKGKLTVSKKAIPEDALMELALDAGAEDVSTLDDERFEIVCGPGDLEKIKDALRAKKIEWESAERVNIPSATQMVDAETAHKLMTLIEALDDEDDVQNVSGNFDIPDEVAAELSGK